MGLHIVGSDGIVLRANKAELSMLGYVSEEYIGRHIAEFHADPAIITDILERLGRGERLESYPARLRAKDGSLRHVLITSSALFNDGKFVHTRCFTVDVTAARVAEEQLKAGEVRFQTMLEALPVAIYTTDADGKITFYNRAAAELAGRQPTLGVDRWCVTWRLFNSDETQLPLDQCPMARALKEQRPIRGAELIAERPDGSRARVVPYPTPLFDDEGGLAGAINMLVDITARYAAEQDSARLAAILLSSRDAIVSTTGDGLITYWSAGAENVYGYEQHEMVGRSITRIIPPELHDQELRVLDRGRHGCVHCERCRALRSVPIRAGRLGTGHGQGGHRLRVRARIRRKRTWVGATAPRRTECDTLDWSRDGYGTQVQFRHEGIYAGGADLSLASIEFELLPTEGVARVEVALAMPFSLWTA